MEIHLILGEFIFVPKKITKLLQIKLKTPNFSFVKLYLIMLCNLIIIWKLLFKPYFILVWFIIIFRLKLVLVCFVSVVNNQFNE